MFVNWQSVDNKLNLFLLGLSQVISVSKDAKSSNVGAGSHLVLSDQFGPDCAQSGHLLLSPEVSLD